MEPAQQFTILIADDEPVIRNGLANSVPWNELGYELVGSCEDGAQVLQVVRSTAVDVALVDIRMPGYSGIDLAQILHRETPETYVLFLTAYSDFEYAQAAIEHGVWRYLVKPVQYGKLLATLRELHDVLSQERTTQGRGTGEHTDPLVRAVDDYIARHFNHASLAEIAHSLELSPEYVSRTYHQRSGTQFSDRLQEVRMNEAARLLRSTRYRVAEISEIVGYSNPKNFSRRFRWHFGVSPREYRLRTD